MPLNFAQRQFDAVGPGAIVGPCSLNVKINDRKASIVNDFVTTHGEAPHISPPTQFGSPNVFVNDLNLNCTNLTVAICQHRGTTGSTNVHVNS